MCRALALAFGLLASVVVPALAGTTGALVGRVLSADQHAPIAGALVVVVSANGDVARVQSDASGSFTFASLSPDEYTITVEHSGYERATFAGFDVFADQTQQLFAELRLHQIAVVSSRGLLDLVRPGTTSDIYSATPELTKLASTLGGSGSLNQAYSALIAMPGVNVPQGQQGWYQFAYIRGGAQDQAGWELDGVPINRTYDNAPMTTLSTLGQQELQVYTGGVPATADAPSLAGYVNQVIKRGAYPGYGEFEIGAGAPAFLHEAKAEIGGMTPDRTFS